MPHLKVDPKQAHCANVTYQVGGQKVSFKAPMGTVFSGIDWKSGKSGRSMMHHEFGTRGDERKINLGKVSEEKHKLLTAIRMADGKPDLSLEDMNILANKKSSKIKGQNQFDSYINSFTKGLGKVDSSICNQAFVESTDPTIFNTKTKRYNQVCVEIPDNN